MSDDRERLWHDLLLRVGTDLECSGVKANVKSDFHSETFEIDGLRFNRDHLCRGLAQTGEEPTEDAARRVLCDIVKHPRKYGPINGRE